MDNSKAALDYYTSLEKDLHEDVFILNELVKESQEELEGNCFYHGAKPGEELLTSWFLRYKRMNLAYCIKSRSCKKVLEIGFNAGHSAAIFLHALPEDGELVIFDLCNHSYTIPCANFLSNRHSQFKKMFVGDSRNTLSKFIELNPSEKETYDVIHVDGGHSTGILGSDLLHADLLLKRGGLLILDDTQLNEMQSYVPRILDNGYTFVYQIPTFGFMHTFFEKS